MLSANAVNPAAYLLARGLFSLLDQSQALTLRWEDIDIKHGFLSISKSR